MDKRLKEYIEKANKVHNYKYDYSKTIYLSKSQGKMTITCPVHKKDFYKRNDSHLSGQGCPDCGIKLRSVDRVVSKEECIKKAVLKHGDSYDYSSVINFTTQRNIYQVTCRKHGKFPIRFDTHLEGRGCKKCGIDKRSNKLRLPIEEFWKRIEDRHFDTYTYENTKYISDNHTIKVTCKIHGDFEVIPSNHFKGSGCSQCNIITSTAEIELRRFLEPYLEFEYSNRNILNNKAELDIFIPELKVAIEYNGVYYHSDKFQPSDYHLNKTTQCINKGIHLIHIFEDEWIYRKDKVKSLLLEAIGQTPNILEVEACEVKIVDQKTYKEFMEINYIDDFVKADVIVGLYNNNNLVSLISENNKELLLVNKLNTQVKGGFEKLLENFKGKHTTLVDLRWSYGEREKALGFKLIEQTPPSYFFTKGQVRTKKEKAGFNKIYDCGTLKLSNLLI